MNMLLEKEDARQLLPQKEPMVMVDALLENGDMYTSSSFLVSQNCLLLKNGKLGPAGLIENIAQTSALRMGYLAKSQGLSRVPKGYIGAVSRFKLHRQAQVGELLQTRITLLNEVFGILLVKGESFVSGQPLAECEMKIGIIAPENA